MDNCYICLEKTSIYFKLLDCNCSIYCHDECFNKILKQNKCIICKKNITSALIDKINEEIEKMFLLKLVKLLHDNFVINNILKMKSKFDLLLFVLYSIIISLITICLSILIITMYFINYLYYYLKYKNVIDKNYIKLKIKK
jgi:hypothetical protein